jgi:hypothetical protein
MTDSSQITATHPTPSPYEGGTNGSAGSESGSDASMKDKASDAAGAAKQAGSDVAATAADKAKDVAAETKRQARDLVSEARGQVSGQLGDQHKNLVSNLRSLADELGNMSNASEQPGVASELVSQAGDRANGVADWLDSREPSQLLDDVRSFARQRPAVFLAGALVAGLAVGRLTRGVVASHTEDSGSGSSVGADDETLAYDTVTDPSFGAGYTPTYDVGSNAAGYSSPPVGGGVAETGPSSGYGGVGDPGTFGEPRHADTETGEGLLPGTSSGFGEPR